jgi:hypothetical protein
MKIQEGTDTTIKGREQQVKKIRNQKIGENKLRRQQSQ